jgi:hypothetical protein
MSESAALFHHPNAKNGGLQKGKTADTSPANNTVISCLLHKSDPLGPPSSLASGVSCDYESEESQGVKILHR